MPNLAALKSNAERAAAEHGHTLAAWCPTVRMMGRCTALAVCVNNCGSWVQVDTRPAPNGIDIGGPAVAVHCKPFPVREADPGDALDLLEAAQ